MKIIKLLLVASLLAGFSVQAQNNLGKSDDVARIAIAPVVGSIPDMPSAAERILLNNNLKV